MISTSSNKHIKELALLMRKSGARREKGLYVAEGLKIFSELPSSAIERLYVSERFYQGMSPQIGEKLQEQEYYLVSDRVFEGLSDTKTPQGVLALCRQTRFSEEEILSTPKHSFLVLETLQDPGNLGTIFRTAEAAGIGAIILDAHSADVYSPKVVRAAMGAVQRVPHMYTEDLPSVLLRMKAAGITLYAAHLQADAYYDGLSYRGRSAFLIGNESKGLSRESSDLADYKIKIPLHGQAESLNASVAASVLMYEWERQKRHEQKV